MPIIETRLINEILTDEKGRRWKFGKRIGKGAFGEVYSGSNIISTKVDDSAKYIIKWEKDSPLESGMKEEVAFYKAVARESKLKKWEKVHKLESLGIPHYIASGIHFWKGKKHRFLVLPRLGMNLHQFIKNTPKQRLSGEVVQALGLQMIDILEYIHSTGHVHDDIKDANILLDVEGSENRFGVPKIHLADYGLVHKFEYHSNPDKSFAGWGTPLFMAKDAYEGAYPRRSDLESLGYNLIDWGGGSLPWQPLTKQVSPPGFEIYELKVKLMKTPCLKTLYSFPNRDYHPVEEFIKYVGKLKREEMPDYSKCRQILSKELGFYSNKTLTVASSSKEIGTERVLRKRPLQEDTANMPVKKKRKCTI